MRETLRSLLLPSCGGSLAGRLRKVVLVCCLAVAAGGTAMAEAQRLVTLELKDRPVREAMDAIERSSDYVFLFSENVGGQLERMVDVSVQNAELVHVLAQLFNGTNISWRIVDRQVLLSSDQAQQPGQRNVTITGRITGDDGTPLIGANVILTENATIGTSTDGEGRYELVIPALGGSLTVSYLGFNNAVIQLRDGTTTYDAVLTPASTEIEGVVVNAGYFSRSRDNFTGSAVVVSGGELRQVNPNNLLQSISAFDPSFRIADNNLAGSNPNALPNINVRGSAALPSEMGTDALRRDNISNSINMPTFILDGYEVGVDKIYDLDMNRVESISILKDAAATAIYGSRAANGVLVITTTAPRVGELRLSATYELTPSFADLSSYDLLGAKEKLQYEVDAGLYDSEQMKGMSPQSLLDSYYTKYYNVLSGFDTDWMAQPVRNAVGNKLSLYLEGGDRTMRYGVSAQFQSMPGVMKGSSRERLGIGADLSYYLGDKLIFKNVLSVSNVVGRNSPYGSFRTYVDMNPYFSMTDPETGDLLQNLYTWTDRFGTDENGNEIGSPRETAVLNPLWDGRESGSFSKDRYWEISDSFSLEWFIVEGLKFRGMVNFTHRDTGADDFISPVANAFYNETDQTKKGKYILTRGDFNNVDASGTLTYGMTWDKHFLNSALGVNMRTENSNSVQTVGVGFTNKKFADISFARSYEEDSKPLTNPQKARLFGSFLSLNYSYDNRYLVDLSGRIDGSSRFGTNNKTAMFWAAGIGWNIHNEKFMESLPIVSRLRLTANTGVTGNDSSNPFQAQTLYTYSNDWYSSGIGASVTQYGNENLKWERTTNTDFGLEVGLVEDRIFLTGHIYNKHTRDMLADIALPASTGFATYKANLGDVENKGWEIGLKANVLKNDDWNIMFTANMVHNRNKILKISDELKKMNDKADDQQDWNGTNNDDKVNNVGVPLLRFREGWSINTIWAVPSMGIDPESGREIFVTTDGRRTYTWSVLDIVPLKDTEPKIEGFFGGSAFYKGFTLNFQFYTRMGGYAYNQTLVDRVENADPYKNVDSRARKDRWMEAGQSALYKDIRNRNAINVSERFIQKENTLELKSVYLSYDFKPAVYEKMGMKTLRVAVTANDLWRASTLKLERGIDFPFARSITFSIQTSF